MTRRKLITNLVLLVVCTGAAMYLALTGRGHHRHRPDTDETAPPSPGSSAPVTPPGR